jgi:hypothetical protein
MQHAVDDTLVLKKRLASVGGLSAFQAETGTYLALALHTLEPALSKVTAPNLIESARFPFCLLLFPGIY